MIALDTLEPPRRDPREWPMLATRLAVIVPTYFNPERLGWRVRDVLVRADDLS